jgi:Na+/glutamate symporter
MEARPYLREVTQLPKLLIATIVLGALTAVTVVVGASLSVIWDIDTDVLSPVVFLLFVATIICAAVELTRNDRKWVRVVGTFVIVATLLVVAAIVLMLAFLAALCQNGCS